jgi:hypothetical protein
MRKCSVAQHKEDVAQYEEDAMQREVDVWHKVDVTWHKEDVAWHKEVWHGMKRMRGEASKVSGESVIEIKNTVKSHS